ncbi:MAG: hypothetical protein R3F55_04450 [Alphaproteobacteria bacterium]
MVPLAGVAVGDEAAALAVRTGKDAAKVQLILDERRGAACDRADGRPRRRDHRAASARLHLRQCPESASQRWNNRLCVLPA